MANDGISGELTTKSAGLPAIFDKNKLITGLVGILATETSPDYALKRVCAVIGDAAWSKDQVQVRIYYGSRVFLSHGFVETSSGAKREFLLPDDFRCMIEIFIKDNQLLTPQEDLKLEAEALIELVVPLLTGILSKIRLKKVHYDIGERQKELSSINQTTRILQSSKSIEEALQTICNILPDGWQYPESTVARIRFNRKEYVSPGFVETPWSMVQQFELSKNKRGTIEIFYLKEFGPEDEGPFLLEERNLLVNISNLISGSATKKVFSKLVHDTAERLKELKAINQTSKIIEEGKPVDETLQEICSIMPRSWQYPRHTVARIKFEGKTYVSRNFKESIWAQTEPFVTIDNKVGSVEVFYLRQFPLEFEGPFLKEERNLLINICKLISGYLNNYKGRNIIHLKGISPHEIHPSDAFHSSLTKNKKPLQLYFNQQAIDKYIYLDMMRYKIKHILFVSTFYDAFTLESEDSFFAKFMGEIYQYSLFSVPRITGASDRKSVV